MDPTGEFSASDLQLGEADKLIYDVATSVLATLYITYCNYGSLLPP
jgi:hypothetical protein